MGLHEAVQDGGVADVRRTPVLPDWIRSFSDPACTNVYELPGFERERKLYGTEILVGRDGVEESSWRYGDWDAELLLLAQDAASVDNIKQRIGQHPDPFCALDWRCNTDGMEANRNLHWLAQQVDCRKLYGSAFAGLLKHGMRSDPPPKSDAIRMHIRKVLQWVTDPAQTPNLRIIACLGNPARDLVADTLVRDRHSRAMLKHGVGSTIRAGRVRVIHLMHPSRINQGKGGCGPRAWASWQRIASECGFKTLRPPWPWKGS